MIGFHRRKIVSQKKRKNSKKKEHADFLEIADKGLKQKRNARKASDQGQKK